MCFLSVRRGFFQTLRLLRTGASRIRQCGRPILARGQQREMLLAAEAEQGVQAQPRRQKRILAGMLMNRALERTDCPRSVE